MELCQLHERFIMERRYLRNVSKATITFYQSCFKALPLNPENYKADLVLGIQRLQGREVQARSINDYIRGNKAFLRWCHEEGIVKEPIKLHWLKEERKVIQTLSDGHVQALLAFRSVGVNLHRAHLIALTIIDTGLRASEGLGLTKEAVDMDNLIVKVIGKGGKHRLVPFSFELRKSLYHFWKTCNPNIYVFGTKNNTKLSVRNLNRDFKILGKKCGITSVRFSPHTLRHTFAVNWIRKGGDLYQLSRVLGHSNISTTALYLKSLGVADLAVTSQRVSLLAR